MTDAIDTEEMVYAWYRHFAPEKANAETIDPILKRYINVEDVLFSRLYKKYVDNRTKDIRLWFQNPEGDKRLKKI